MADLNTTIFSGRITSNPKLIYIDKNNEKIPVANFTVASEDPFGKTSYIPVIVWRNYAEACANYLEKGQEVFVTGKLYSRQNKEKTQTFLEVHATEVKFGNKAGNTYE